MSDLMQIAGTEIRERDGLYSVTDLFKASGSVEDRYKPTAWLKLKRTKLLVAEMENYFSGLSTNKIPDKGTLHPIVTDKKAGTFACEELLVAYATHLSPKFEREVVQCFLQHARKQRRMAFLHGKAEWHQNREQGKMQRKQLTDEIKRFTEYATANGSKSGERYYTSITRMTNNACGITARECATPDQLAVLSIAEIAAEREIAHGLVIRTEYHQLYRDVKAAVFAQVLALPEVVADGEEEIQ